jgi:hypothetical protein
MDQTKFAVLEISGGISIIPQREGLLSGAPARPDAGHFRNRARMASTSSVAR